MKTVKLIFSAFRDLLVRTVPANKKKERYHFAFLVHTRNIHDVYRKYPFMKILPKRMVLIIARHMWPVVVSEVTGLKSLKTGQEVRGVIIGFLMTAHQMMEDRKLALKRIMDSTILAKKMGANIIGLGALTSSLSRGGLDIVNKIDVNVTTGHAYTAHTVASNVFRVIQMFNLPKDHIRVGVVGASGSVGSTTALLLVREGIEHIHLLEVERKISKMDSVIHTLKKINPKTEFTLSSDMFSLRTMDIIVTATNAPEAVLYNKHIKPGAIVIDDAQPSDVAPEVLENEDVLVLEAGVVHTPHVDNHFKFGLKDKYDNFCCLCEIMILAANEWEGHYVVNRANLHLIDKIVDMSNGLGFRLAELQNFKETISKNKIENIKRILTKKSHVHV